MRIEDKYIAHDPELQEKFLNALSRSSIKGRTRFSSEMIFFDIERYIYYLEVWIHTEQVEHLVKNSHLRGNGHHLDHIIPLSYGFTYNIAPEIIGSFFNLQIITAKENLHKGKQINEQSKELLSKINYDTTFYPKNTKIVYSTTSFYSNYKWEDRELIFERDA